MNGWVNNREAGDLRRHRAHYDVTVMMHAISGSNVMGYYTEARRYMDNILTTTISSAISDIKIFETWCMFH